jgi:serine/threonine protein kinase
MSYSELESHLLSVPAAKGEQETLSWCDDFLKEHGVRLGRVLGKGHYGTVYEGCEGDKCSKKVVKLSSLEDERKRAVFDQEVKTLTRLQSPPRIVPELFASGICRNTEPFKSEQGVHGVIIEERFDGDLSQWSRDKFYDNFRRHYDNKLRLFGKIYELLLLLHEAKLVNLDVKPDNILYRRLQDPTSVPHLVLGDTGFVSHSQPTSESYYLDLGKMAVQLCRLASTYGL